MLGRIREIYWQVRKDPADWADILIQDFSAAARARLKYAGELGYWRSELRNLDRWYLKGEMDWWGLAPPGARQAAGGRLWSTEAIHHLHRFYPLLLEELGVEADALAGQRVLEIGCGPIVPILQFADCERHGIDPLLNAYAEAGWPIFDLEVRLLNGRAEAMPYPDGYFDAVVSRNSLDHVDDLDAVAAEIVRVLRPGGRFLCSAEYHPPTREEPHSLDDAAMRRLFGGLEMTKLRERSRLELQQDFARRFGLSLDRLNARNSPDSPNRYVAWHGTRPG